MTIDLDPSALTSGTAVAVATDAAGQTSAPVSLAVGSVVIGQLTANYTVTLPDGSTQLVVTNQYSAGNPLSFHVAGAIGYTGDLSFYLSPGDSDVFQPGAATLLGTASHTSDGWTLSGIDPSGWIGDETVFVSTGGGAQPIQFTVVSDQPCILARIHIGSLSRPDAGQQVWNNAFPKGTPESDAAQGIQKDGTKFPDDTKLPPTSANRAIMERKFSDAIHAAQEGSQEYKDLLRDFHHMEDYWGVEKEN